MPESCVIFTPNRLHAPCSVCGEIPERPHVAEVSASVLGVFCAAHCPWHAPIEEQRQVEEASA